MRFLKRLWGGRPSTVSDEIAPHLAARPDAGRRLYAVGDIHGRLDLLDKLHAMIIEDMAAAPRMRAALIYLGDYVDRGPQSRQVLDRLIDDPLPGFDLIHLCGNHDDFLMKFFEDPSVGTLWMQHGGIETLASYGVTLEKDGEADLVALRDQLLKRLPETHRDFLRRLRYSYQEDGYFFAHAGVKPKVALEAQSPYDLMWIREEFLESRADFGKVVVHGHTPVAAPENLPNRIGVDTGACWTGHLTAVVLDGGSRRFLATG